MKRQCLGLLTAAMLASASNVAATEVKEMRQLIRFLDDRIATEDPGLEPAFRFKALLASLEMMGILVPPSAQAGGPVSHAALAQAILADPTPTPPAPGLVLMPSPEQMAEAAAARRQAARERETVPLDPFEAHDVALAEDGEVYDVWEGGPPPAPTPPPVAPSTAAPPPSEALPLPPAARRRPDFEMPPVALIARSFMENPKDNPWKPVRKPLSTDHLGPPPAAHAALATRSPTVAGSLKGRLNEILGRMRAGRLSGPPEASTWQPPGLPAGEKAAEEAPASPSPRGTPARVREYLAARAQATQPTQRVEASPPALPPSTTEVATGGYVRGLADQVLSTVDRQPRVAVPREGQVLALENGRQRLLEGGSHLVAWGAELQVQAGERVLVVYPGEGAIFRLSSGAAGLIKETGVVEVSEGVDKFLSRPGDPTQVFHPDGSVAVPKATAAHPDPVVTMPPDALPSLAAQVMQGLSSHNAALPELMIPLDGAAVVHTEGTQRNLGPGHHELAWGSRIQVLEGNSAKVTYPGAEKVYKFSRSAEGYVETSGIRPRSDGIQEAGL